MTRLARLAVVLLAAPWLSLAAQVAPPDSAKRDTVIPDSRLFVRSDLWILAAFAGGMVAMFPLDRDLTERIRNERLINNATLNRIEHTLDYLGSAAPVLIGGTMYVVGRVFDVPRAAHLAVHTTEAVVVGVVTAGALKVLLGRARPYMSADTNPGNFGFARGLRGKAYQSFPSGHSTTSFAVAAAMTAETSEWWPRSRWIIGPILYGGATLVGLSRMYDDKHWASDVVLGAAIGTFAGLKTVRFNHTRTGNRIDRWLLGDASDRAHLTITPRSDGSWRTGVVVSW